MCPVCRMLQQRKLCHSSKVQHAPSFTGGYIKLQEAPCGIQGLLSYSINFQVYLSIRKIVHVIIFAYNIKDLHRHHISNCWVTNKILCLLLYLNIFKLPVSVTARSKAQVYGRSSAEIVGSNPTGDMDVCLLRALCVERQRSLRRIEHSSEGVLPNMARRCV